MVYLKLYAPELSFEQKKIAASELTKTIRLTLDLGEETQNDTIIRFIPYRLDNLAVGGRLSSETEEPEYRLEISSPPLSQSQKNALSRQIFSQMGELFGLHHSAVHRITVQFHEHAGEDIITGRYLLHAEAGF